MITVSSEARVATARFGQLIIGPPGSGKTTYCDHMAKLLTEIGRKVAIVNLGIVPYLDQHII